MELKEFISETIQQISLGVKDAMEKCSELDVIVNPDVTVGSNGDYFVPQKETGVAMQRRVQVIDMDIAITVTESQGNAATGKIGVSIFSISGETKGGKNTSNESRVRFSIPVCLPVSKVNVKPRVSGF